MGLRCGGEVCCRALVCVWCVVGWFGCVCSAWCFCLCGWWVVVDSFRLDCCCFCLVVTALDCRLVGGYWLFTVVWWLWLGCLR